MEEKLGGSEAGVEAVLHESCSTVGIGNHGGATTKLLRANDSLGITFSGRLSAVAGKVRQCAIKEAIWNALA